MALAHLRRVRRIQLRSGRGLAGLQQRIGLRPRIRLRQQLVLQEVPHRLGDRLLLLDFLLLEREALRLGTRIALLDRGRLEVLATPQEFLKSQEPVTRAFLAVLETGPKTSADERP